jgi:P27 family predicted phage terminase small subunit
MGERGPLPQSAELRLITGINKKSTTKPSVLTDALRPKVDIPDCPDYLLPVAKTEWHRIAPELKRLHIISQIDLAALAMYCQTYAQWVGAQLKIQELDIDGLVASTPNGYQQLSAWYLVSSKAFEQMRSMLAEFGLSPLTRARIAPNVCTNVDLFDDLPDAGQEPPVADAKTHGPDRFFT